MGGWSVPRALLCPHGPISTQQTGLVKQMKRPCIKMGTSLLFPVRIVVLQESSEFLLLGQASVYPPNASLAVLFSSIYFEGRISPVTSTGSCSASLVLHFSMNQRHP